MLGYLVIICSLVHGIIGQRISPCPDVFTYDTTSEENGKWYGEINLQTQDELAGIWLRIILDNQADALVNWLGETTTTDNVQFLIKNPQRRLVPGRPHSVRFYIKYSTDETVPNLIGIRLNGRVICSQDEDRTTSSERTYISQVIKESTENPSRNKGAWTSGSLANRQTTGIRVDKRPIMDGNEFFSGDFPLLRPQGQPSPTRPSIANRQEPISCGTVAKRATPLITRGQKSAEGDWPWHFALYRSEGIQWTYICGGSLVSRKYAITAAHCVTRPGTAKPSNSQGLLIYLGTHNLKNFGNGIQIMQISDIIVNPDYNSSYFYNDLALLKLAKSAEITDYVRPVCLWEDDTDLQNIVGKLGTVVGWGFDENRHITEDLMEAKMPVVASHTCIYSKPDFFSKFTSETSYCAGFRNGTSVCNGDSGGGMIFPKSGTSGEGTVWQLRGLVSVSLPLQGVTICDPSHYIIFTDTAQHLTWIKQTINA